MESDKALVVFQGKQIRRTWFNDEWWFVAIDIIGVLTDSKDLGWYLKDMRRRDEGFDENYWQTPEALMKDTETVMELLGLKYEDRE